MKKTLQKTALVLGLSMLSGVAIAEQQATVGWDRVMYWNWDYVPDHLYIPLNGKYRESYHRRKNALVSYLSFTFNPMNVHFIKHYNERRGKEGCRGFNSYFTVDISANPHSRWGREVLDADYIVTNLPYPKIDDENDTSINGVGFGLREEAEVVAQGTVKSGKRYYVKVYWKDYRNSNGGWRDKGSIGVNFAMSRKWHNGGDYNNCHDQDIANIVNYYSDKRGAL